MLFADLEGDGGVDEPLPLSPLEVPVLCPSCHHIVGAMSREDQYAIKADPIYMREQRPYGTLVARREELRQIGSLVYRH